jgi:hypothetical protein
MSTQLGGAQVLLDHTYTPGGTQMITGVLCSSNCAVAAVCQLFWLLPHAQGRARRTHSQVHLQLPLSDLTPEKTQANNH